jgi:type IV secretory pathway TraG/TraD family ATPase VirD4
MNWPLRLAQSVIPPGLHWFLGLKHSEVHGRARWMNAREEHAFLAAGHPGLACGPGRRLSSDESFKNLVLVAPTGSGKTTRYVIPNLLQLQGSAVVTDPSGEIYRATSGHLARQGYSVQVLQPAAPNESLKGTVAKIRSRRVKAGSHRWLTHKCRTAG